jgi:hypothetical protein
VDEGSSAAFDDFCDQLLAPGNGSTHASIGGVKISHALVNYGRYMTEVGPLFRGLVRTVLNRQLVRQRGLPAAEHRGRSEWCAVVVLRPLNISLVLHVVRRQRLPGDRPRPDMASVALPDLHPVGLLAGKCRYLTLLHGAELTTRTSGRQHRPPTRLRASSPGTIRYHTPPSFASRYACLLPWSSWMRAHTICA